ncbi:MAG: Asp-tRNA(Asn)/Glu-tRNA(Gln) amidotransferase subunit GatB [Anaerolineae bacterium]|nr:Asp-tRNA(Asn)/Glu-tRNA(Gln) amidotransferase subunit GatB [Anaerolineae bacterium]
MSQEFEAVIGLEVHAVLETRTKMFCDCPVVDSTHGEPNTAVCPVCSGMPGVLPVINQGAVEYALRVALALECEISNTSIFARKSYFYPDLPKGYQISQYEQPLARSGRLNIDISGGEQIIRVRRVHIEEDTGKLTHMQQNGQSYSLVDLNRSGLPLLEIVSEPDMHSVESVRAYAFGLRSIMRYLGVNSGNLEKGLFRIEPNISMRPVGSQALGTRTEIKNMNSFRSLERGVAYEIERQTELLRQGKPVIQETLGWDDARQVTVSQRGKEDAEDYRYFPEPDLPPLVVEDGWVAQIKASLPELPHAKLKRFQKEYSLSAYDAGVLVAERAVADYFEETAAAAPQSTPKMVANWISGELFGLLNQHNLSIEQVALAPRELAALLEMIAAGEINQNTGKEVLAEMLAMGKTAEEIVDARGLKQVSDGELIAGMVAGVLAENPEQVAAFIGGKEAIAGWLFGQVMQAAKGKANPQVVRVELDRQLKDLAK